MQTVIFILLVSISFNFILTVKLGVKEKMGASRYKTLYRISACNFCFNFWVGAIATIIYWLLPYAIILTPFAVSGLWLVLVTYTKMNEDEQ